MQGVLGAEAGDRGEMAMINRRVSWKQRGLELRADPRHAEDIVKGVGLTSEAKGLDSPGKDAREDNDDSKDIFVVDAKRYRGLAARANHIGSSLRRRPAVQRASQLRRIGHPWNGSARYPPIRAQELGVRLRRGVHRHRLGLVPHHSQVCEWGCALRRGAHCQDMVCDEGARYTQVYRQAAKAGALGSCCRLVVVSGSRSTFAPTRLLVVPSPHRAFAL